jgi:glycosyltransferase involved in cell wall biosynthesis
VAPVRRARARIGARPACRLTVAAPLVSIIIPCHNAAPWLAATIESALAQTWAPVEIMVIDDGSTDGSPAVAQGFAARGVRLHTQPNRGASAARNRGLREAQGEFIQFLDADDLLAPDKIRRQLHRLQAAEPGAIASGAWTRFHRDPAEGRFVPEPTWRDLDGLEFLLLHYEAGWMMVPAAWLCPRRVLDAAGPWDEALSLNDDGEYFGRAVLQARGILFCAEAQAFYRSGLPGSLSRRTGRRALESLWRSTELTVGRMLTAASFSARARAAAANGWQRLAFECYPAAPDLASAAEKRSRELGGSPFPWPGGPAFHRLARLVGWRTAKRVRDVVNRRRAPL